MKKILYIISTFPGASETFILREIDAWQSQRLELLIYALRADKLLPVLKEKKWTLIYRKEMPAIRSLTVIFQLLVTKPISLIAVWRYIFSFPNLRRPGYLCKLIRNSYFIVALVPYVKDVGVTAIHAHFADMATDLALILHELTGIPYRFSVHARDLFVSAPNLVVKCRRAQAVFACSQFAASVLHDKTNTHNIHVMYHGLDLSNPLWQKSYQIRLHNFDRLYNQPSVIRLLAVGRFVPKKGFHLLIDAARILKSENFHFHCRIIGGGQLKNKLQRQITRLDLQAEIELIDFMHFERLISEFMNSHLLVQPSCVAEDGDQDNIPNVILEAQALGVPVLAASLPSIQEVMQHELTGFLIPAPAADAIAQQISHIFINKHMLKTVISEAYKQVYEKFDVFKNVSAFQKNF